MASIAPSERLRRELQDVIDGAGEEHEAIGRLGARLILQQALEEELSDFLGRERYERRGEPLAHRNGYESLTVKTTAGPLELARPRLRNASALGFASAIVGKGVARTHALEALVVCTVAPSSTAQTPARLPAKARAHSFSPGEDHPTALRSAAYSPGDGRRSASSTARIIVREGGNCRCANPPIVRGEAIRLV